jgi:hypothetical protein
LASSSTLLLAGGQTALLATKRHRVTAVGPQSTLRRVDAMTRLLIPGTIPILVVATLLAACAAGEVPAPSPSASAGPTLSSDTPRPTSTPSSQPTLTPAPDAADACPTDPSLGHVVALSPARRLACFGDAQLTLRGWVWESRLVTDCLSEPDAVAPNWLTCILSTQSLSPVELPAGDDADLHPFADAEQFLGLLTLHATPDGPIGPIELDQRDGPLPVNRWVEVSGHFDDPAAALCADDPAVALDACRQSFVVTAARLIRFPELVPPGSLAVVTAAELRLRHAPRLTAEAYDVLERGASVYVMDGPRTLDGWRWYLVSPGDEVPDYTDGDSWGPRGWVASGEEAAPFLEAQTVTCADAAAYRDLAHLTTVPRWERLQCATGQQLTFEGVLCTVQGEDPCATVEGCSYIDTAPLVPTWLSYTCHGLAVSPEAVSLPIHIRAEHHVDLSYPHGIGVRVIGHFDDPEAMTCEDQTPVAGVPWLWYPPVLREARVTACREAFVVDSLQRLSP